MTSSPNSPATSTGYFQITVQASSAWPGNPKDEYTVDEDDLVERYGDAWNKTYDDWMDRYTAAFEKQELHLGSYNATAFPDLEERKAWVVEGMLLA
ncbi:hypothetical protein PG984_011806 [Apiospora sp. TS-2023a]